MKIRLFSTFALGFALSTFMCAQEVSQQNQNQNSNSDMGAGARWGQRGGRGMGMGMGRGVQGTVTEVAADHYTVKTFNGEKYTIFFSANTRMMKQPAEMGRRRGQGPGGNGEGSGQGWRDGGNP